jgi:hypothetical protein
MVHREIVFRQPWLIQGALQLVICVLGSSRLNADDEAVSFNRDVRPILADTCLLCHGPDAATREADLRLDLADGALGGENPVLVPGKPEESRLFQRITSTDEAEVMPPPDSKKQLTAAQKDTLKRWIEQGAKYQKHWSFEPIQRPEPPAAPDVINPIDAFLTARLEKAGLTPQPQADRETLIRRVSFTLTGLPPTLAEIDEYLADTSPQAYEHMIDRYLASPRYGEEMARHWLDVARYADTHGLHLDNERQMWAYRDWVVKAFNHNLPYDQFTVWQVAGDMLPQPSTEQLVATGFNRCNVTTSEGGSIAEEFVYRYAVERTTAVAQAWLGLTAGCAVCHDHKYDPLTMKEFYSLYAFFNSAADPAMDGNNNTTPPYLKLPTKEQQATADAAGTVEREARAWLETAAAHAAYVDPSQAAEPMVRKKVRDSLFDDAFPLGATSRSSSRNAVAWVCDPPMGAASGRRVIRQAFAAGYNDVVEFKLRPVVVPHDGSFELSIWLDASETPKTIKLSVSPGGAATWSNTAAGFVRDGGATPLTVGQWTQVVIPLSELGLKPGDQINSVTLSEEGGVVYWDNLALVGSVDPAADPSESFAVWRKAVGNSPPPDAPAELHKLFRDVAKQPLSEEEASQLRTFYLSVVARPVNTELASARGAWEAARIARITAEESAPGTFIFRDTPSPRDSFVMVRGQYDKPGEKVEPGIPAALPQIDLGGQDRRLTRLDLANWLVSSENPLTARVTVNRFWQQVFGTGIVKTSYDFGAQGESPSHPELLDWLAAEFRDSGWNVKQFMKQLLMSDAFRRHAKLTAEVKAADPANRLYARGPRFRLDAEQVRDNALFVSGLMNPQMGGRGINPYQPPNLWEPVGYSDSNTRYYLQDHGADLYRRSLYVFLKRTAPPPFMTNFDGPNREQVCIVRDRSNTPLQALQLMNDVQHFEAARALAERILADAKASDDEKISTLYRIVLSRRPDPEELAAVTTALVTQRELYQADPSGAAQAIHIGESKPRGLAPHEETAAWTMIANLIMNLDETVTRN